MLLRKAWLALTFLSLIPAAASAQDTQPTVTIRVRSLDTFRDDVKMLVTLAGREEIAKQVEGLIQGKAGDKGLVGVDTTKPLGAYARFGPGLDDLSGALMIPIADEKSFLSLLENLNLPTSKWKDDIYGVGVGLPVNVFLRFAHGYAYISAPNPKALEGANLLEPKAVLGDKTAPALSLTIRMDQMPDAAKLIALNQLEQELNAIKVQLPMVDSAALNSLHRDMIDGLGLTAAQILKQGKEIQFTFDVNRKTNEIALRLSLSGLPETDLAKSIATLGQKQNLFAGLKTKDAVFFGQATFAVPESVQKTTNQLVEVVRTQALAEMPNPAGKKFVEQVLDSAGPTLKSGEVDGVMVAYATKDPPLTYLFAVKVRDGVAMGQKLKSAMTEALAAKGPQEGAKFQFDVARAGDIPIHRMQFPIAGGTAAMIGATKDGGTLHVAFRDDAIFLALGERGLETLTAALRVQKGGAVPVMAYEIDLASFLPKTAKEKAAAAKAFTPGQPSQLRLTINSGGELAMEATVPLSLLAYTRGLQEP